MIDRQTIDRIMDTAQILDVVSEFVSLKRRGQNYIGLCPFHNEKTPSFSVSPARNICKCFSCGKGGNPLHFLMEHEQMTFVEAIRWLGNKYGIEIEERNMTNEEREAQTTREGMLMLNEFARDTFARELFETAEGKNVGLSYFRERGFQDETIRRFHLGYALDSKTAFSQQALQKGYRRDYLLKTGLCYGDEKDTFPINRFRGRVVFPFHSLSGKVVAFGGRVLVRASHTAMKYVNSPESEIYHKSNNLYGIFEAKQAIAKADKCYLVEGYTDVLSMSQAGIRNVVASSGTALTSGQIRMIQRFTKNITVLYDGDAAGIKASLRGIDMLLLEGMNVKVLLLPPDEDPDSFARKHTSEELLAYIAANETDFIRFKTRLLMADTAGDPLKRAQMIQSIVQSISIIPDSIVASVYIRETSRMVEMSERDLVHALNIQRQKNYEAELRKEEIERRRTQNLLDNRPEVDVETENAETADASMSNEPLVNQASEPVLQPSAPPISVRRPLLTDRFERNILRYIVRSGGELFNLKLEEPNGQEQVETWRVIDFVCNELYQEQIEFRHPLYARMYNMALAASEDAAVPFDSVRYFGSLTEKEVADVAFDLMADKYDALGLVEDEGQLEVLVPRSVLELKEAIVREQIAELKQQLMNPQADVVEIMRQLQEKNEIRKALEKDLGERIITI